MSSWARAALCVSWLATGCLIYDPDALDRCIRTVCDDGTADGAAGTSAGGPVATSGGRAGAAGNAGGRGGSGVDSGRDDASRPIGAGGATGTGSGGSGAGDDEGPDATTRDASGDATATVDGGPDPTAGCPSSLSFTNRTSTAQHGMPQNGPTSTDVCPDGQVLTGYRLSATTPSNFPTALVSRIEPSCGKISVAAEKAGCTIVVSPGDALPTRGRYSNGATTQFCPPNQVIVTFKGRSGRDTDQLGFGCAPLELTKVSSGYRATVGVVTSLGTVGGNGGSAFQDGCPSDQVAIGNKITDENGFIGAFGLVCASVTLAP